MFGKMIRRAKQIVSELESEGWQYVSHETRFGVLDDFKLERTVERHGLRMPVTFLVRCLYDDKRIFYIRGREVVKTEEFC